MARHPLGFWSRLRSRRVRPADQESSYRAIERLIATYAELVDDGDFAAVGRLLSDATFTGGAGAVSGADAIEKMLRENVIVYDDDTPRTKHLTTNLAIEVDEEAGHGGVARVLHRAPGAAWPGVSSRSSAVGTTIASNGAGDTGVS